MAGRSLVRQKLRRAVSLLPESYAGFWADVKHRVQMAQVRATLAANEELISLYWDIGRAIHEKQAEQGWRAKIIDQLAIDLRREFPDFQGFSRTNIYRMRAFYVAWREEQAIVPQPVGQLREQSVPQPMGRLPWGHNVVLLERIANRAERLWYARAALEYGWSRSVLHAVPFLRKQVRYNHADLDLTAELKEWIDLTKRRSREFGLRFVPRIHLNVLLPMRRLLRQVLDDPKNPEWHNVIAEIWKNEGKWKCLFRSPLEPTEDY
jgi:predicted nuclease of restriction endonuclease-like (RecB) superfamily